MKYIKQLLLFLLAILRALLYEWIVRLFELVECSLRKFAGGAPGLVCQVVSIAPPKSTVSKSAILLTNAQIL